MIYRNLCQEIELRSKLLESIKKFDELLFLDGNIISKTNILKIITSKDTLSFMYEFDKLDNVDRLVLNTVIGACEKAEGLSGCSSRLTAKFLLTYLKNSLRQ